MSTQQFAHLLAEYVIKRHLRSDQDDTDTGSGSFSDTVWNDIEGIFKKFSGNIRTKNVYNAPVCDVSFPGNGMKVRMQKIICLSIVNIFLFMDGIDNVGGAWERRNKIKKGNDFEDYVRCILGNVILIELFGRNCNHVKIIDTVSSSMKIWRDMLQWEDGSKMCEDFNYNNIRIGGKLIGLTMAAWIRQWRRTNWPGTIAGGTRGEICAAGNFGRRENPQGNVQDEPKVHIIRMFDDGSAREVHELLETGKDMSEQEKRRMVKEIKKESSATVLASAATENRHTSGKPQSPKSAAKHGPIVSKRVMNVAENCPKYKKKQHC
ncbi:hypothetical protein AK88_04611 [Plasmodium fragile]|uniref:Schizont-infected cell agglutination extracellular alpha domain-containing protein n=1 Tax=Plasmodium fragile TaxID=5857 RepID=A0A0D9QJ46_PLAFR|nr:uncharacterized protein AK88_04611 [Plasmodium fragile]KJP85741.1 hypothetical protein AK88_04611 [Plasmodium fragile]